MSSPIPNEANVPVPLRQHSVTSGAPEEMFSPTSAAAWALSTMHNFGAAAPPHNTANRPDVKALTGTRLFNGAVCNGGPGPTQQSNTNAPALTTIEPTTSMKESTSSSSAVSWGNLQVHQVNSSNVVGPSPPISRSGSVQSYDVPNAVFSGTTDCLNQQSFRLASSMSFVTPTPKKQKSEHHVPISAGYSRKNKSLGVLAENFINMYHPYPSGCDIVVDNAARDLGVERRRIYDVVNILESIQIVSKEKKNTYKWMGLQKMDEVFGKLQERAILEYPDDAKVYLEFPDEHVVATKESGKYPSTSKSHVNKSLAKLSQEFLQLYLVGLKTLSLPEASDKIQGTTSIEELINIGGGPDLRLNPDGSLNHEFEKQRKAAAARGLKTKIRRLYDIANVFISVGLLEKIESTAIGASRRPNFSWNYKLSPQEIRTRHVESLSKTPSESSTDISPKGTQDGEAIQHSGTNVSEEPASTLDEVSVEDSNRAELDLTNLPVLSEEEKLELDSPAAVNEDTRTSTSLPGM